MDIRHLKVPSWVKIVGKYSGRSLWEFRYVLMFGLMPLWAAWLILYILGRDGNAYAYSYLQNGEALIVCASTLGPLMYHLLDAEGTRRNKSFPLRNLYITAIFVICIVAAIMLGARQIPGVVTQFSSIRMVVLSGGLSVASFLVWLLVTGTAAALSEGAPAVMRQDADDYIKEFLEPEQ